VRAEDVLTATAVRLAAARMMEDALADRLQHWTVDLEAMPGITQLVSDITKRNYPDLRIPFHSRWRHFSVGGVDRWAALRTGMEPLDPLERARRAFDLVIPSVLTDAGAGSRWTFFDATANRNFSASEGLALASLELYQQGTAISPRGALDADWLENISEAQFANAYQASEANPLHGVSGRVELLRSLGRVCKARSDIFALAGPARPGGLVDAIVRRSPSQRILASDILEVVLDALGAIWPSRLSLDGISLGDSWVYRPWITGKALAPDSIVPFHKLSQWLTYSLIEPLQEAGIAVQEVDGLTGLAEYRNGGLFVDGNVLKPRDSKLLGRAHKPDSELVVEWRAMTIGLLDMLKPAVAGQLGFSPNQFPLPCLLEGGTWSAGRSLAQSLRADRSPPVQIVSDGTVF
jgi:Protein of unknown function (DUF1688)